MNRDTYCHSDMTEWSLKTGCSWSLTQVSLYTHTHARTHNTHTCMHTPAESRVCPVQVASIGINSKGLRIANAGINDHLLIFSREPGSLDGWRVPLRPVDLKETTSCIHKHTLHVNGPDATTKYLLN